MGLTTKLAAAAAKHDEKQCAKLGERHREILAPGETIMATITAVTPDTPQPSAWLNGAVAGMAGYFIGNAIDRPKAKARSMAVQEHLGTSFAHFPESKNGYQIALTEMRVLVFDGRGKELVSEGPISAMNVSSIDHDAGLSSIVFSNGSEHIAVTSARGRSREVKAFVGAFPNDMAITPPPAAMAPASASPGTGVLEF